MKRIKPLLTAIMWAVIDFCIVVYINISDRIKKARECLFYRDYRNLLFYKIGFYFMSMLCTCLFIAWIATAISRDNQAEINRHNTKLLITYKVMLQKSIRETDILIDVLTAQDKGVWEIYCDQIREFKLNHARRHGNENKSY